MLNTVLFDMGGTLEDIWNNQETLAAVMEKLQAMLRAAGLEPGCGQAEFQEKVLAGLKEYKNWSESVWLEKKPEEIWPDFYLKAFHFDREKLLPITEELANMWELTYFHRELRPGVHEMLEALEQRGYKLGVISNNASLYNVFNVLEDYGIRRFANPTRRFSASPCGRCRCGQRTACTLGIPSPGISLAPSGRVLPRRCRLDRIFPPKRTRRLRIRRRGRICSFRISGN